MIPAQISARRDRHAAAREAALASAMQDVARELKLIDLADLVAYVRFDRFPNIADLVSSSIELMFAPGTLSFGWAADLDLAWDAPARVMLDMEFRHRAVTAFFSLELTAGDATVRIHHISFEPASPDPAENTRSLVDALDSARSVGTMPDPSSYNA
jgi:hypothetical protein